LRPSRGKNPTLGFLRPSERIDSERPSRGPVPKGPVRGTRRSPHGRPPFLKRGGKSLRLVEGTREGNSQIPSRATPLFRKGVSKSATCRRDLRAPSRGGRRVPHGSLPREGNSQIFEDGPLLLKRRGAVLEVCDLFQDGPIYIYIKGRPEDFCVMRAPHGSLSRALSRNSPLPRRGEGRLIREYQLNCPGRPPST